MRRPIVTAAAAWLGLAGVGLAQQAPTLDTIEVNGASIVYQAQGQGAPSVPAPLKLPGI